MNPIKLFICHSSKDKSFVRDFKKALDSFRYEVWLDENEIQVGDSIYEKIEKGLLNSDYILLILSPNFAISKWSQQELRSSFQLEMDLGKKILPCLIEDTQIPPLISDRKYADFRISFSKGLIEIINAITPKEKNPLDVYATDAVVILDIIKDDGSFVKYTKNTTHISLINNLTTYIDCLSVAGQITDLQVTGANVIREWIESGFKFWEIKYPYSLYQGQEINIVTTANFLNSFTSDNEYWETLSNNHSADKFKVIVIFPKNRFPKHWYLEERVGTRYFNKADNNNISCFVSDNRFHLILEVTNPVHHTAYLLRWTW
ncbi:toll/interleukin-1 receptor domain-containing protein [Cytophagaceae bacterium DM2B3-1]|uniref:Toll/interleukin-1 receptor domain-containing protein n=1 Tax=Xanthocytophaga flava TaxID=3048013 RepID=A0ABT7CXB2_9BACT|nr:toll/interleukin-1 receptor domain-containing protein [Xanthocytophaga flavus]MDJ1498405.1 toll/interleukin-1 receptor domain-containing protein [Xanthocytophaga flavus]